MAQIESHQAGLLAGRVMVWSPWEPALIPQTDTLMDVWWMEQVQQPPAVEKLIFAHRQTLPSCLPASLPGWTWVLLCAHACMCICLYLSVSLYTSTVCKRIRQLQSWAPCRKATFADLFLPGQPSWSQSAFSLSSLEKWTEYDPWSDDNDGGGDRLCSITGRLMIYPSAQPLCVNATLNYHVVFGEWSEQLFWLRGIYVSRTENK